MEGSDLNGLLGQLLCHVSCFYDVYSHQDLRLKRSSPNPPKRRNNRVTWLICSLRQQFFNRSVSISWDALQMFIKSSQNQHKRAYKLWCDSGEVYPSPKRFLPMKIKKTFMKTHRVSLFSSSCCFCFYALHMIEIKRHIYMRRSVVLF